MKFLLSRFFTILADGFAASAPYYAMPYFIRAYPHHRWTRAGR